MNKLLIIPIIISFLACNEQKSNLEKETIQNDIKAQISGTSLVILGTAQDAGSPQIGCKKACCKGLFKNVNEKRSVVSLGLIDADNNKNYLFEATPDIGSQIEKLSTLTPLSKNLVDGIFLTHAHIGHYTGLMYLGKEAINSNEIPVYAMPKMGTFLRSNGPWSQLIENKNINLKALSNNKRVQLSEKISVTPIQVPHRDEFSETVGYRIKGPNKSALFIPDIDKWEKWELSIIEEIRNVDYAFLDATFYSGKEINNRDISEIPHPFIIESIEKFKELPDDEKSKVIFIHFNHTNPVLNPTSKESKLVLDKGFKVAREGAIYEL